MFKWKIEDMALLNEKGRIFIGDKRVYRPENTTSREDKIAFVDSMQDGKLSYLLNLIAKFKQDYKTMPKDEFGNVKARSLQAWIARNDTRGIIDNSYYHRGKFFMMGSTRYIEFNRKGDYDLHEDLVDEMFHRQLQRCEDHERQYFQEHDEYSILAKKFVEYQRRYGTTFGTIISHWSDGKLTVRDETHKQERPLTMDELKELIAKYEQIDALVAKLTAETNITY